MIKVMVMRKMIAVTVEVMVKEGLVTVMRTTTVRMIVTQTMMMRAEVDEVMVTGAKTTGKVVRTRVKRESCQSTMLTIGQGAHHLRGLEKAVCKDSCW